MKWGVTEHLTTKKDVEYLLQTGCNYLQSIIKDYVGESEDKTFDDLERLKKVLYNEGQMMSLTKRVKFEKRINSIEKKLEKIFR